MGSCPLTPPLRADGPPRQLLQSFLRGAARVPGPEIHRRVPGRSSPSVPVRLGHTGRGRGAD